MCVYCSCRNISLIGNSLQCKGLIELIRPLVSLCQTAGSSTATGDAHAEETAISKVDTTPSHTPTTKKTAMEREVEIKAGEAEEGQGSTTLPELLMPTLARLDIRDNSIDSHGICVEEQVLTFEPIICMRAVKR